MKKRGLTSHAMLGNAGGGAYGADNPSRNKVNVESIPGKLFFLY